MKNTNFLFPLFIILISSIHINALTISNAEKDFTPIQKQNIEIDNKVEGKNDIQYLEREK